MNLRDISYFIAVAETGHVGKASEKCFVSQPTLSVQLQKLESELGVQLFERQHKKLILSKAGEELLAQAQQVLQDVADLKLSAKALSDPYAGEFKMGIIPTVCPYVLPRLVRKVKDEMPKLSLQINELQTEPVLKRLLNGDIDAAILATDEANELLDSKLLFSEDFYYAVGDKNSFNENTVIDPESLLEDSLLLLEDGHCLRDQGLKVCGNQSGLLNDNYRATSMQTLLAMVAAGYGATLVPESIMNYYHKMPGLYFLPLKKPVPTRKIYLVSRKSSVRKLCIEKLVALLAKI